MPYANIEDRRAANRRWASTRTREQRREEKRRQRARWREAGLNSDGKPIVRHDLHDRALERFGHHPRGCCCYDCLWGGA